MDRWIRLSWGKARRWRWPVIGLSVALLAICVVGWRNYELAQDVGHNAQRIGHVAGDTRKALCSLARLVRLSAPTAPRYPGEPIEDRLRRQALAYAYLRGIDAARCRPPVDGF